MKAAEETIITTDRGNLTYYLSIIEKQNDSGIMWNERVLFLLSGHHIGYISDVKLKQTADQINFEKPKVTVLLTNIKGIVAKQSQLSIKFYLIDGNKKSERNWILRMKTQALVHQWYQLLQKEKIKSTTLKSSKYIDSPTKKSELLKQPSFFQQEPKKPVVKQQSPKEKKNFEINRYVEHTEQSKRQRQVKQIGIGVSPKNVQPIQQPKFFKNSEEQLNKIMSNSSPKASRLGKQAAKPQPIQIKPIEKVESKIEKSNSKIQLNQSIIQNKDASSIKNKSTAKNQTLEISQIIQEKPNKINLSNRDYLQRTNKLAKTFNQKKSLLYDQNSQNVEYLRQAQKQNQVPWTFKYLKFNHLIFGAFRLYTKTLMEDLIKDISLNKSRGKYKPKLIKDNIRYYDIDNIEVKLAMIGLEDANDESIVDGLRICDKKALKLLQKEFNNFNALYEYLSSSSNLKVPMVSLCEYHGFIALFKIVSHNVKKQIRYKQIQSQLHQLERVSKISKSWFDNAKGVIIQLDSTYYDQFRQSEEDINLNLNVYFIQEIDDFLLPDVITDQPNGNVLTMRKEIMENYTEEQAHKINYPSQNKPYISPEDKWQVEKISKTILKALSDVIVEMDILQCYFLNSKQLSNYLHEKGVNIRYLGHIYQHLKTIFQRRFVMTEMAARSCKSLFRKTIQDIIIDQGKFAAEQIFNKLCDFFNCVLGNTYQTAAIWKVISNHSHSYFGLPLNFDQIDRGHFVISLIQNCKLDVLWEKIKPEQAFKSNIFFSEKNLLGLVSEQRTFKPVHSNQLIRIRRILAQQQNIDNFQSIINDLNLKKDVIPTYLRCIEPEIKRYLSYFITPEKYKAQYRHLKLFQYEIVCPSKHYFSLLLTQIKWALKLDKKEEYIINCDQFIKVATTFYGEFHPIFSQLYDVFSTFHLSNSQYEDSITFAKSSLVNTLKICGTNHQKTAECYYHLALCYIKANKREQAIAHIKKAKHIFDLNNKSQTIPYAIISLKLGLLFLNQNQIEQCLNSTTVSLDIFQTQSIQRQGRYEDEITECIEMLNRCYQLVEDKGLMKELSDGCAIKLKGISKAYNLEKLLKIFLQPIFSSLTPQNASNYLDIISSLTITLDQKSYSSAFSFIKERIDQQSFIPCLQTYLPQLTQIQVKIRQSGLLGQWQPFSQVYKRETIPDFISLTVEWLVFLGEGFVTGSLRSAL